MGMLSFLTSSSTAVAASASQPMPTNVPINAPTYQDITPGVDPQMSRIMIVDDESINIRVVRKYLEKVGYQQFIELTDSTQALTTIMREQPDVVLLDVMMPEVNGLEILHAVRNEPSLRDLPVIILTAASDGTTKLEALDLGATEFLPKPVHQVELILRVRNALLIKSHLDELANYWERLECLVRERTKELEKSRKEVIDCLARAAESRDGETGQHVVRVGRYAGVIAQQLGFPRDYVELMEEAAKLHDVGKIGIPDAILLKPGKLESSEYEVMKSHCILGTEIIQEMPKDSNRGTVAKHNPTKQIREILSRDGSPLLTLAALIAQTHHEKWDGTGYPFGLKGEEIPIEGRIVAVADVFDALCTKRHYKPSFSLTKCFEFLHERRGKHFDPKVLEAFFTKHKEVIAIQQQLAN
jgi:putative two-component system response regulator